MREDWPLLSDALRPARRRRVRCRPRAPLALVCFGLAALGFAALADPAPRLVWNASASAPIGLYWVSQSVPVRGDFVLVVPPPEARRLASERGYLPAGVPLVKRVTALAGDTVCAFGKTISINGRKVAGRLNADRRGRPLPQWTGCRVLAADEVFLLMTQVTDSFDGRYFGPTRRDAVLGRLVPLWTE